MAERKRRCRSDTGGQRIGRLFSAAAVAGLLLMEAGSATETTGVAVAPESVGLLPQRTGRRVVPVPQPAANRAEVPQLPKQTVTDQPFFLFSSTQFSYTYLADTRYPGFPGLRPKTFLPGRSAPANMLSITHADAWEYGTNFINLDLARSGSQTPAGSPLPQLANFDYGQTTLLFTYRGTLSGNVFAGAPVFTVPGLIKNMSLAYGVDHQSDNTLSSLLKTRVVGGVSLALDVPVGFVNVSLLVQKDWFRFADLVPPLRDTTGDTVPRMEVAYHLPLTFTDLPLALSGFFAYALPRGLNPHGGNMKAEVVSRSDLVLDIGALADQQPERVKAFIGFLWLQDMNGANPRFTPGAVTKSFLAGLSFTVF
ncbi:MAG TPA: hypothetical protein K8W01_08820 [Methylorubrum populi]|uniref:Uncharacterized protein n=1 Tax=Methylorubrum populi TaxID=223967 RepID=A0A921E1W3_9HYPH|nr:hypothetical protein [Methylorubrum populi]